MIEPAPSAVEDELKVTLVFGSTGLALGEKAACGLPPLPTVTVCGWAMAGSTVPSTASVSVTVMLIVRAPGVAKVSVTELPLAAVPAMSQVTVSMSLSGSVDVEVNV